MKDLKIDRLGRATFHHITPRSDVRPTAREIRWLKHIERHGPQTSEFLYELTRDTHRCKDTSLRDMQKLRSGGFLRLPQQQLSTDRAPFNAYVYDLTQQSINHLSGLGLKEPTIRPTGHWWHQFLTSTFTGSLDIATAREGRKFVPGHKILERSGTELAVPVGARKIIPDQLFAVRYEYGYRAFLLETDRGTEPKRSGQARKSLQQSIDLYTEMLAEDRHKSHYGLTANVLLLWVFTNPVRQAGFQELVSDRAGKYAGFFLSKVMPEKITWDALVEVHRAPWRSGDGRKVLGL